MRMARRRLVYEVMTLGREDRADGRPHMLVRHEFVQVLGTERPSVDDLMAMRVDDLDRLALGEPAGAALARRKGNDFGCRHECLRYLEFDVIEVNARSGGRSARNAPDSTKSFTAAISGCEKPVLIVSGHEHA